MYTQKTFKPLNGIVVKWVVWKGKTQGVVYGTQVLFGNVSVGLSARLPRGEAIRQAEQHLAREARRNDRTN